MMLMPRSRPRAAADVVQPLRQVEHHRQVEQRLPAEEHQRDVLRRNAIHLALDPRRRLRRGVQRHLLGELVVVAVIALEAVVAREIALERRQDGDVQLGRIGGDAREVAIQGQMIRLPIRRPGSHSRAATSAVSRSSPVSASNEARPSRRSSRAVDVRRDDQLRVGQRVHQEHVVAAGKRHTDVENGRLHPSWTSPLLAAETWLPDRILFARRARSRARLEAATRVPVTASVCDLARIAEENHRSVRSRTGAARLFHAARGTTRCLGGGGRPGLRGN